MPFSGVGPFWRDRTSAVCSLLRPRRVGSVIFSGKLPLYSRRSWCCTYNINRCIVSMYKSKYKAACPLMSFSNANGARAICRAHTMVMLFSIFYSYFRFMSRRHRRARSARPSTCRRPKGFRTPPGASSPTRPPPGFACTPRGTRWRGTV